MIVVQDVLPKPVADDLRNLFRCALYKQEAQISDRYYPNGEPYKCRFKRAHEAENDPRFGAAGMVVARVLTEMKLFGESVCLYAYKMTDGDFFREHDDSRNGTGFILYMMEKWIADWGGILMVKEGDGYTSYVPKFNQLIVIDKGKPHFVTPVTEYALEPRYAMVGFVK